MEAVLSLLFLLILGVVVTVPVLAIVAFIRSGRMEKRIQAIEVKLSSMAIQEPGASAPVETSARCVSSTSVETPAAAPTLSAPVAVVPLRASATGVQTSHAKCSAPSATPTSEPLSGGAGQSRLAPRAEESGTFGIETQLGIRVAAWIGVAMLLIGAGFFITYAIQRQWVSPGVRVTFGILFGAALTAAAYGLEGRGYRILARVLTAGGGAAMYFSVFAARGFYGIIGPVPAFLGLALVSVCSMALSALYNSQAIALGALLGALFVPPLTGSETDSGIFLLCYVTALNIPAIGLGLKRRWQGLYTVAAALAWIAYFWAAMNKLDGLHNEDWPARLIFAFVFFAQFTALSMIKLWNEPMVRRPLDFARQSINSALLLVAVYMSLKDAELNDWMGAAMLACAGGHLWLSAVARKRLPLFANDAMIYLLGAATFVVFAVPLQFDGAWVSAAWAVEGLLLAWFASRIGSPLLRVVALTLTALGWFKALLFDGTLYDSKPALFLNGRFAAGLAAALSFFFQSRFARFGDSAAEEEQTGIWQEVIIAAALFASTIALAAECWFILGFDSAMGAALGTFGMAAAAALAFLKSEDTPEWRILRGAAWALALLTVMKILTIDRWSLARTPSDDMPALVNTPVIFFLVSCGAITSLCGRSRGGQSAVVHIAAPLAAIITVTTEIGRADWPWREAAITIFWACSAMVLVWCGLLSRRRYFRWFGLTVFAAAALKALLVDLSGLRGMPRIISFVAAGLLFLALSFAYQKLLKYVGATAERESKRED